MGQKLKNKYLYFNIKLNTLNHVKYLIWIQALQYTQMDYGMNTF
jgi:hypothetical protein